MTPKEKAKELVYRFSQSQDEDGFINKNKFRHRQSALIAVDEIINSSPSLPIQGSGGYFGEDIELSTNWWKEVKQELEKL